MIWISKSLVEKGKKCGLQKCSSSHLLFYIIGIIRCNKYSNKMKKLVLFIMLLIGVAVAQAREPYGDYVCRYVYNNQTGSLQSSYNPLKITHYGLQVKNTNAGTKTWEAKYQGPIRLTWRNGESHRFHNLYLVNQRVEFSISDDPFITYNGKRYYVINFDGQWQLAEAIY